MSTFVSVLCRQHCLPPWVWEHPSTLLPTGQRAGNGSASGQKVTATLDHHHRCNGYSGTVLFTSLNGLIRQVWNKELSLTSSIPSDKTMNVINDILLEQFFKMVIKKYIILPKSPPVLSTQRSCSQNMRRIPCEMPWQIFRLNISLDMRVHGSLPL